VNAREVRELLESRRSELSEELARLLAAPRDPTAAVSFGKRIGDGTTEAVERFSTTAAARSLASTAREVERALEKLDEGSYGRCDRCGGVIGSDRLEARPWTVLCVECASRSPDRGGS
jgi:DnaK suppressor protein